MTKSQLIQRLAKKHPELSAREVARMVAFVLEAMRDTLAAGGRVELRDFAVFFLRELPGRKGRNPRTGESVDVPLRRVVRFRMGKRLYDTLNAIPPGRGG